MDRNTALSGDFAPIYKGLARQKGATGNRVKLSPALILSFHFLSGGLKIMSENVAAKNSSLFSDEVHQECEENK